MIALILVVEVLICFCAIEILAVLMSSMFREKLAKNKMHISYLMYSVGMIKIINMLLKNRFVQVY